MLLAWICARSAAAVLPGKADASHSIWCVGHPTPCSACEAFCHASQRATNAALFLVEDREASQAARLLAQAIVQILQPLAGPKVGEAVRKTVNEMFGVFAQSMAAAFQKFMRPDGTFPPRLGEQMILHLC